MPIGYLITVALLALGTAFALSPPRRPAALRRAALVPTMVLNEVPLPALLLLAVATALAFAEGNVDSAAAWAGVGLAAVTAVGLVFLARRATLARPVLKRALAAGLGREADGAAAVPPPSGPALLATGIVPWLFPRGGVRRRADLPYGEAGERNLLDLYAPSSARPGAPTLVYFHGGGYFRGRKSKEARALLYRLAREGWTCVSANYRLRPQAGLADHLADAKRAISWARRDAGQGAEPGPLFVAGSSAGGHLAALAALTPNEPALQPGFEWSDTSVSGAICLYAYLGNYYGMGAESSPRGRIRADAPPFFIAQGELDTYSPRFVSIARGFAAELDEVSSSPVVYAELPGAQHAFDIVGSVRFDAVVDAVVAFTDSVRDRGKGGDHVRAN